MLERGAQLGTAAMDPAADGAKLDAEDVRDLLVRQALDVAEDDGGAIFRRQVGERSGDVMIEMTLVEGLRRSRLGALQPGRRFLAESLEPNPLLPARDVQEQVRGDAMEPALESPRRVAWQRPEHAHEDLLREVLGVVAVAGQPVGQPIDPRSEEHTSELQ